MIRCYNLKKTFLLIIALIFVLISTDSSADRGLFWWDSDARFTQSAQKAIIFHNFKEEVLILETELQANMATEALEFIPFPSEPEVELAKGDPFKEMNKIINKKRLSFEELYFKGSPLSEPVEVRESKKIGPHDVTVIKINSVEGFNEWVLNFLKNKKIRVESKTLKNISEVANDYIQRGIQYFVFDYVKVENLFQRVEPLIYRFKTDKLYYPLKTSNTIGGEGRVEIVMIMPEFFEGTRREMREISKPFPEYNMPMLSNHAEITISELSLIYEKLDNFFLKDKKLYIQMLRYRGEYRFKDDLNLDISKIVKDRQNFKKDLIDATLTAIDKSWQKISKDSCVVLTDEIKNQFEKWRKDFSSMKPEGYRVRTVFPIDIYEIKSLQIGGFGPLYPPSSIRIKINKPLKMGDVIRKDDRSIYEVIKVSDNLKSTDLTERMITLYAIYTEYDIVYLSNRCIFRVDTRKPKPTHYYVYVDE
ncbi:MULTISPECIES: DUF2330 domain-containing protein [Thermodesulfovibrio]|jgi:hypothetical protein|uniref:DUF2330 domain-containing protein n=1 Tax=Thermodesulfovibrio TaxID=28261 RepID=UPI002610BE0F|nr:DUF2330 domain-containing protein [Thermodesulfovibrio sp.]